MLDAGCCRFRSSLDDNIKDGSKLRDRHLLPPLSDIISPPSRRRSVHHNEPTFPFCVPIKARRRNHQPLSLIDSSETGQPPTNDLKNKTFRKLFLSVASSINMAQSALEELMAMGYPQTHAKRALEITDGDMEQAVGYLLMGDHSRAQLDTSSFLQDSIADVADVLPEDTSPDAARPGAFAVGTDNVMELVQMGYSEKVARDALRVANGDMGQAINYLLMGESRAAFDVQPFQESDDDVAFALALQTAEIAEIDDPGEATPAHHTLRPESAMYHSTNNRNNFDVPRMVVSETFLRTEGAGPFCACIAASKFLSGGIVTAEFLNEIMGGGIELFRKSDSPIWDVAHVLHKYGKATLNIEAIMEEGEPKDGVHMANDLHQLVGFRKLIAACRNQQPAGWQVLILEIPNFESICIALPPKGTKNKFWYLDFYPRSCFRVSGAYARVHSTLLQLEESLEAIFNGLLSRSKKEYENFKIYRIKKIKNSR